MARVNPYHTSSDEDDPVYHTYDDCPAGERVIADGNAVQGASGRKCDFCTTRESTGHF
jgi:hypothetical protein